MFILGRCFRPCLCPRLGPSAGLEGQSVPHSANQLPSTSCPKRKTRTSLEMEGPRGQCVCHGPSREARTLLVSGHQPTPTPTPLATAASLRRTACSSDYWKLSIFDKMILFVLGGSAFILFFAFILDIPCKVHPAFLAPQVCTTSCARTEGKPGEGRVSSRSDAGRGGGAVEGWAGSTCRVAAKLSTWDSSALLAALANWGQGSGSPFSGPRGEPFQAEGAVGRKVHPLWDSRKPRLGRALLSF